MKNKVQQNQIKEEVVLSKEVEIVLIHLTKGEIGQPHIREEGIVLNLLKEVGIGKKENSLDLPEEEEK